MLNPEELNLREIKEYYKYKGVAGTIILYLRFAVGWILQLFARSCPLSEMAVFFQRRRGVKIGKHVYLGQEVYIDDLYPGLVVIEDYVSIGMRTMIFTHANPTNSIELKLKYYPRKVAPVTIKRGACIFPGCIIICGVTIGENSVVGAGSVVIRDVEPNSVTAGNPARTVKYLGK